MNTPTEGLYFPLNQFDGLFPYFFILNKNLVVEEAGTSLKKLIPEITGRHFNDMFVFKRPFYNQPSFEEIAQIGTRLVVLEPTGISKIILRGQLITYGEYGDLLVFYGSPWFYSIEELKPLGLTLADFAVHDPITDLLQVLKAQEIANDEMKSLLSQLNRQKKDLKTFSLLAAETINGVIVADADGCIEWVNAAFERITGYQLSEVAGQKPGAFLQGPATDPQTTSYLREQIRNGQSFECDILNYHKNGTPYWVHISGQPLRNAAGKVVQFFAIEEDITERRQAQEALRISEQRLKNLITNLPVGVLMEDENRRIVHTNDRFCEMFAIPAPPEALTGADCIAASEQSKYLFADPEGFITRIGQLLTKKELAQDDELLLADGRIFERTYVPIFINDQYRGHLWEYADITQRKESEIQLRKQEERYRRIIENMNLGLLEVDLQGRIMYANQSFCRLSGYGLHELLDQSAEDLFADEKGKVILKEKDKKRSADISDAYEIEVTDRWGEKRWWLISGAPLYNDDDALIGSTGIHLDITDRINLEKDLNEAKLQAEQSAKAKENFLANMSHEIRTPMNAITGLTKQLLKSELNNQQRLYLNSIGKASENLLVIINDILDVSKIEAGKLNLEKRGFNLIEILQQCIHILQHKAEEKGLNLTMDISPDIAPLFIGDPYRLNQILMNLLSNAVKFTEKGYISLTASVIQQHKNSQDIELAITDTGIGMDADFLNVVFDKFSQENEFVMKKYGGTGLGMSISKQLTELMGGHIAIQSKKNEGTTATIRIPLTIGIQSDITHNEPVSMATDALNGASILLVEDNPLNRLVATTILEQYQAQVTEAENGKQAIAQLNREAFDLILMDVQMPEMDGLEATSVIRQNISKNIPIIALTAYAIKSELDKCIAAGMNDCVTKPFDELQLIQTIGKWLQKTPPPAANLVASKKKQYVVTGKFDLTKLETISKGNPDFVKKMLALFLRETPAKVQEIKAAYLNREYKNVKALAHRIKPSLDDMGINSLKNEIRQIEHLAEQGESTDELFDLIEFLCLEINEVSNSIKAYLEKN